MKGQQVNFFMLPPDLEAFEKAARQKGALLAFEYHQPQPRVAPVDTLQVPKMGESPLTIYLAREVDADRVRFKRVLPTQWSVDDLRSPVVELIRCYSDGKIVRRGRLYFTTGFFNELRQWEEKPDDFVTWAKSLLQLVRKDKTYTKTTSGDYVAPHAARWQETTGGQLAST